MIQITNHYKLGFKHHKLSLFKWKIFRLAHVIGTLRANLFGRLSNLQKWSLIGLQGVGLGGWSFRSRACPTSFP